LSRALDEGEFLSEYGIRSYVPFRLYRLPGKINVGIRLSLHHKESPYSIQVNGESYEVGYWPGDSHSGMFGELQFQFYIID
jgi:hypothetical protein